MGVDEGCACSAKVDAAGVYVCSVELDAPAVCVRSGECGEPGDFAWSPYLVGIVNNRDNTFGAERL